MRRAAYIAGLRAELASQLSRPAPSERRVAAIESELDRFAEQPVTRVRETATTTVLTEEIVGEAAGVELEPVLPPGPLSSSRARSRGPRR